MKFIFLLLFVSLLAYAAGPVGGTYFQGKQIATPSTPPSGHDDFYFRTSDGLPVWLDSSAVVHTFSGIPASPNMSFQFNNTGSFGGVPSVLYDGTNPYSTGNFGFNQTSPQYPADVTSVQLSVLPPATVTVLAAYADPSIIGQCVQGFDNTTPIFQYYNDQTNCTVNGTTPQGFCYDGSTPIPGDNTQTLCTNDGFTWYINLFNPYTPGAPHTPPPTNDTVVTYTLNSYENADGFYSATGTTTNYTTELDTNPASFNAVQNEAETGYTANGTMYTWIIYSLSSFGTRTQGTMVTATDSNDGHAFAWDLTWAQPTNPAGTPPGGYLVLNQTTGNAAVTMTESITDDNSWAAFSDPGYATIKYTVAWSSVAGVSEYHITGPGGYFADYIYGLSFIDYGDPYLNNSSPNPRGPKAEIGLHVDGSVVIEDTVGNSSVDVPLKVYSPMNGNCGYAQQWFNGNNGALEAYVDCQGTFVGNFNPISGNLQIGGTLTAGTVSTANFHNSNNFGTFNWSENSGNNNFFRVDNGTASSVMETQPPILFFDENVTSGTPVNGFGGGIGFRAADSTTAQVQSGAIFSGWANATHATYAGLMRQCVYDHNNTSTPICFLDAASDGNGTVTTTFKSGDVQITKLGTTLHIASGANACSGQATLSGGTVTVSTTCTPTTNDGIFLTNAGGGANPGYLYLGTVTSGTSFVVRSSDASDSDKVNWMIIKH